MNSVKSSHPSMHGVSIFSQLKNKSPTNQKASPSLRSSIHQKEVVEETHMNHAEIVRRLNSVSGKSWQAGIPVSMAQMSLQSMNKRAGIRSSKPRFDYKHSTGSFVQTGSSTSQDYAHFEQEDLSKLPKSFSWESKIHPARSQGECGSCYTIATAAMLSSRLWIQSGDSTQLSPQHSLDCNFYNQGCDGGYGFLVSKFFSEFEAVPESCHPYLAVDGKCSTCDVESLEHKYVVTDYKYIGGSYGKSSERAMMEEIKKNGPIVVNFEPSFEFMYYKSGIFHSVEANSWIAGHESKPTWQKVDHAVLCYGWGEDEQGKFWLIQNSWGEEWGENGSFKMRRGTDESNVESMGEMATIKKVPRNNKSFVQKSSRAQ